MPNKAIAAGGTTALAGALVTVILSLLHHPATPELEGALTTIVGALLSGVATYYTKNGDH